MEIVYGVFIVAAFITGYFIGERNAVIEVTEITEEEKEFMKAMANFLNYDGKVDGNKKE